MTTCAFEAATVAAFAALLRLDPAVDPAAGRTPASSIVLPALTGVRAAMAAAGWDPDAPSLRHVALDLPVRSDLRAGRAVAVEVVGTGLGRVGRGAGLGCRLELTQEGRPVASVGAVVQDGAHPTDGRVGDGPTERLDAAAWVGPVGGLGPDAVEAGGPTTFRTEDVATYLALAGDAVPIHDDAEVARAQGLAGAIVPGFLVAAHLLEVAAAGAPRLRVRFRHPVLVDTRVQVWHDPPTPGRPEHRLALRDGNGTDLARAVAGPP